MSLFLIFMCKPVKSFWERLHFMDPGYCVSRRTTAKVFIGLTISGATWDIGMAILPAFMIWELNMTRKNKLVASSLVLFGVV